jgi:hypothetical protein
MVMGTSKSVNSAERAARILRDRPMPELQAKKPSYAKAFSRKPPKPVKDD